VSSSTVGRKLGFWPFLTFSTISAQRNNSWCYCYRVVSHKAYGSVTCCRTLRHGTDGFTSPPKEVALWICIALKIHRPRPGVNSRISSSMASTLTTRPPRTTQRKQSLPHLWA
jgi:hypothetical protein